MFILVERHSRRLASMIDPPMYQLSCCIGAFIWPIVMRRIIKR